MKFNLNSILTILGGLGIFAPDVSAIATWMASMNIAWLAIPIRVLGTLAVFFAAAPLVVPRLRSFLASLGMATPPGAVAPWNPEKDAGPSKPKDSGHIRLPFMMALGLVGSFVGFLAVAVSVNGCATTSKFTNAVVECAEDVATNNPTAVANVRTCLIGLTGGGYMQCLSTLPFAAELVICIVSDMSRGTAAAMNSGDVDPVTATINRNANDFLRTNNISRK